MKFDDSGLDEVLALVDSTERLVSPSPSSAEIRNAARWCMECDPSEGFRQILVSMLQQLGYGDVAARL